VAELITEAESSADGPTEAPRRRRFGSHWRAIVVAAVVLLSIGIAAVLYFGMYRPDQGESAQAGAAIGAASQGAVAVLSYAPKTLDKDLAAARTHLTGDFLTYYGDFANQFIAPAAKQKDIQATATVVRAALIDMRGDTAHVLVFLNQSTTSHDNPAPAQAASSVNVGLTKVAGTWRISSFDPM